MIKLSHTVLFVIAFLSATLTPFNVYAQSKSLCIIDDIAALENVKDPKCQATANRLEDFMYGTPLLDEARLKKSDFQKKLVLYIWDAATKEAENLGFDSITIEALDPITKSLSTFGRQADGYWYLESTEGRILISANDLRQYSSVAYALRAMLSVEQDFLFNPSWELKPITDKATYAIKLYLDLVTLATLKIADEKARTENTFSISADLFENAWERVLRSSKDHIFIDRQYPEDKVVSAGNNGFITLDKIIDQKIESYTAYNDISLPILLRNIQVYFARHKWPTAQESSENLKNYLIESLVYFCTSLIERSDALAKAENLKYIRGKQVNEVVSQFMPFEVNQFEDVIYFPASEKSLTIESYDLDAFRDSGLHWLILKFAIDDMEKSSTLEPDPFAAEIIVESVAQMALLVLRVTGNEAQENGHPYIMLEDMESAFKIIQEMIFAYPSVLEEQKKQEANPISTAENTTNVSDRVFVDITKESGIDFMHKSSDWLSRLIRSYVLLEEEQLVRMAIPPAFGGSGIAAEDINNDQLPDIIISGGLGIKVYLNKGDKTFEDITASSGIDTWNKEKNAYSEPRQIIVADFNNDGWQDIFISLVDDTHKMYKNINGFRFEDVSATAALGGKGLVGGPATALDYDKDGWLDIYIGYFGNYLEGRLPTLDRNNQNGDKNVLFKNKGAFTFEEKSYCSDEQQDFGWTQALGHTDINQDGWQDIIVGNDFGINAYYINQGDGSFINKNKELNTDKPSYTMNVGSTDLNGDMYPDLYISNIVVMEKDEKYVNPAGQTRMNFELEKMKNIRTVEANDLFISKVTDNKLHSYVKSDKVGRGYSSTGWSWDADFFDFDNDGDEDLYCLNGMNDFRVYGSENPYYNSPDGESAEVLYAQSHKEKNNFFINENGQLIDKASELGADLLSNSRSAAYLDFDGDGDLDIVVNNYHDKAIFLENTISNSFNWIKIKLQGAPDEKITLDAVGANIIVTNPANGERWWREVKSTTGYLSVHPKLQHFGLGDAQEVNVELRWPNGHSQSFEGLAANASYLVSYEKGLKRIP